MFESHIGIYAWTTFYVQHITRSHIVPVFVAYTLDCRYVMLTDAARSGDGTRPQAGVTQPPAGRWVDGRPPAWHARPREHKHPTQGRRGKQTHTAIKKLHIPIIMALEGRAAREPRGGNYRGKRREQSLCDTVHMIMTSHAQIKYFPDHLSC